jgi:hypothetical protein
MSQACKYDPLSPCEECDRCYGIRNNTHVYCTKCNNFELNEIGEDDYTPDCKYKDKCDLQDCEDSRPFKDRPYYEE